MFSRFVPALRRRVARRPDAARWPSRRNRWNLRPKFESLETRALLTVTLDSSGLLHDYTVLDGKYFYLPLNSSDDTSSAVSYQITSSDSGIQNSAVVLSGSSGPVVDLNVTGNDSTSTQFTGDIFIQLFNTLTPNTVAHFENLVGQNFYNALQFFRVSDSNLIAQAGSPTNDGQGGSGPSGASAPIDDEFNTKLTFNSPGLLAMANSGPDTQDSQFFLTQTGSDHTNPTNFNSAALESYDFNYTIIGQIVGGFDTFQAMMGTPVMGNPNFSGENSLPVSPVTINSATIVTDNHDAILQLFIPSGFSSASVTVTATGGNNLTDQRTFNLTGQVDAASEKPFIQPFTTPQITNQNTPISFQIPLQHLNGSIPDNLSVELLDPSTNQPPTNADIVVSVDQTALVASVTVTPHAGFSGNINLKAYVSADSFANALSTYDSEALTVQVNAPVTPLTLDPNGLLHNYQALDGKYMYLPLNSTDTNSVSYQVSSSDPNIQATVIHGTVIDLAVSGVDSTNTPFSGDIKIQLFDTLTPQTVAHILSLVNSGFYNGHDFFRILANQIAQAGSPTDNGLGGSPLGNFDDEFTTQLTFNSPGLVAMANSGADTNDSQFFLTQTGASPSQPTNFDPTFLETQGYDFTYAIFGQIVSGFNFFQQLMSTPVTTNPSNTSETSKPITPVVITSASVITDNNDAILQLFMPTSFGTGNSTIMVTATDSANNTASKSITLTGQVDTFNDKPFIAPFTNTANTNENTGVTFQIPMVDINPGDTLSFIIVDPATGQSPTNATITGNVDQTTRIATITITPNQNITGKLRLLAAVSDTSNGFNTATTFDSQAITLTVGIYIDGTTLHVGGSANADNIKLSYSGTSVLVTLNGTQQSYPLAGLTQISLDGGVAGADQTIVTGHPDFPETANLTALGMTITGGPLPVNVVDSPIDYFYGQTDDTALLHGVRGSSDTFVGTSTYAVFTSPFFINEAAGTGKTYGYAGGDDYAYMYSASGAHYIATPTYDYMSGSGFFTQATNFPQTYGVGSGSATEQAYFYSVANANLVSSLAFTSMSGSGFFTQTQGFKTLVANSSGTGTDTAWFYGAGNTTLVSTPTYAYITGGGVFNQATGFRTVYANAGASSDVAYLYDSTGDDHLSANGKQATLVTPNETTAVNGFGTVTAQSTQGTDFKSLAAIDFVLNAVGNWKSAVTTGGQTGNR